MDDQLSVDEISDSKISLENIIEPALPTRSPNTNSDDGDNEPLIYAARSRPSSLNSIPSRSPSNHSLASSSNAAKSSITVNRTRPSPTRKGGSPGAERAIVGQMLTSSTIFYDIPMSDAFSELLERYLPHEERPQRDMLSDTDKNKGPEVLVGLVMNNMWRSVARYARQKLVQTDPTDLEEIFQLWYTRLLALTKLGLYQLASAEFDKLGDLNRPELTYEYYPQAYPDCSGSIVPFELLVLWASLPAWLKAPLTALERISMLAIRCKKMQLKTDSALWRKREIQMYLVLATKLMEMQDFAAATSTMEMILQHYATNPNGDEDIDILSGLGRLYVQLGDIASAENIFGRIESQREVSTSTSIEEVIKINRALLLIAKGKWNQAYNVLQEVVHTNNENLLAIERLRTLTAENPTIAGACETVLMNMCTLFELRYESPTEKQIDVMKQVSRWIGDNFRAECLRLQP
ncbi:Trafficking protein particle complex subunit 12 [Apophysomyces ossiformis]|uniref:Trafficking protein particle complex subunit 12 n=1 Tax=Apophysomyces ossiformis TaxID=679940 RepID=A0A8H7ETG8_9FUNG|nr:Trafficking protein particle complex subunit 12 [Apophysomyces ossiformis]